MTDVRFGDHATALLAFAAASGTLRRGYAPTELARLLAERADPGTILEAANDAAIAAAEAADERFAPTLFEFVAATQGSCACWTYGSGRTFARLYGDASGWVVDGGIYPTAHLPTADSLRSAAESWDARIAAAQAILAEIPEAAPPPLRPFEDEAEA
jgi:hypothetical protein